MRILSEHYQRRWLAGILSEFWWIVDLLNVFQRWLAAEHQEGKGTRPPAKAQVSIRNSCDFNYTWYLLILIFFEPSNMRIKQALIAYHARFWGDYWSVLKWHDCIGSKSLCFLISWYFVLNMVRTHVQLSMSSQWWNLKYISMFNITLFLLLDTGNTGVWTLNWGGHGDDIAQHHNKFGCERMCKLVLANIWFPL